MNQHPLPPGNWVKPKKRLSDFPKEQQTLVQRFLMLIVRLRAKSESDLNVFKMLIRLGKIFPRYLIFLSHILMKGRISRADKERIILRAAWKLGCIYEWGHHAKMAAEEGVEEDVIASLANPEFHNHDERLQALVVATDQLIDHRRIDDKAWSELAKHLTEEQRVEFCMLVGHYVMVAMSINTTGVEIEPGYLFDQPEA